MDQIRRIAILMTVHNRKQETLRCLTLLHTAINQLDDDVQFDVYMTDDGSTDGTQKAVKEAFPDVVVISGDGNMFWCWGMIKAWEYAVTINSYNGFLWLNDDSYLYPNAIVVMCEAIRKTEDSAIISGAFCSEATGKQTYGGRVNDRILAPDGELQPFIQLNGNFVYIPQKVFEQLGVLDNAFHHAIGDYDYGYRALKAGVKLYLTPCYVGVCERNADYRYRDPQYSLTERFRFLYSPFGPSPSELFRFNTRHFSVFKAIGIFIYTNFVCLFPWVRRMYF
jgi:GT2 family glycosyltransferase